MWTLDMYTGSLSMLLLIEMPRFIDHVTEERSTFRVRLVTLQNTCLHMYTYIPTLLRSLLDLDKRVHRRMWGECGSSYTVMR